MSHLIRTSLGTALTIAALTASSAGFAGVPGTSSDFNCENCPLRIPDAGALAGTPDLAEATTTVTSAACSGGAALGGVQVVVNVSHGHVGDLRLRLVDPLGGSYVLSDRVAQSGGASGSCTGDDIGLIYDDGAGAVQPSCQEIIPSLQGVSRPVTAMTALVGTIQTGVWTLEAGDHAIGGEGLIDSWQLRFVCSADLTVFYDGFED